MNKSLFSKWIIPALLVLPLVFTACEKNHFKSFIIGDTSGDGVIHRTSAITCTHPGTAGSNCMVDINEDENNDLTFLHSVNANNENVTSVRGPSGFSIVIDSVWTARNQIFPTDLELDTELSNTNLWFNLSSDVNMINFLDLGGDNEGYYGFRWGTNTQRTYGWIKLRKTNDTDFVIDEWAFQEFVETVD